MDEHVVQIKRYCVFKLFNKKRRFKSTRFSVNLVLTTYVYMINQEHL